MKRINLLIAVLFFILATIVLYPLKQGLVLIPLDLLVSNYGPWFMAGQILLKNPYMQDAILQYYPWHHLVFESFKNGIIPFWNPYQIMGMPFMAGTKPMVFYPFNIFYVFGEVTQWHISIFLQMFLSMCFVYILARDFKLGKVASILSAISFSLCSLMVGFLEFISDPNAIIWFPLFIFFAKRFIDQKSGKYLFFLGISVAFSIFAGHMQYSGYGLILAGSFILYYGYWQKIKIKTYFYLYLSIMLGILSSSIQLFPAFELFSNSFRGLSNSHEVFAADLLSPNQLLRLFSPDFFGNPTERNLTSGYIESSGYFGIISFFFAFYAVLFARKNNIVKFLAAFFLGAAFFALKWPAEIIYFLKIPLITNGSGGRIFGIVMICGSLLAGFGIEQFLKDKPKKNILAICGFGSIFALGILLNFKRALFLHDIIFQIIIFTVFAFLVLVYLILNKKSKWLKGILVILLVSLTFFDLFRLAYRYLTFSNSKFIYPQTGAITFIKENSVKNLDRTYGLTEPEIQTYFSINSIETYNPLYLKKSGELLQALQKQPINKLPVNKYYMIKNDDLKFALDFTGVSFLALPTPNSPSLFFFNSPKFEGNFSKVYSDGKTNVYQNHEAFPRFGLYYDYKVATPKDELEIIADRSIDFRKTLLLEEKLPIELSQGTGSARLISSNVNSQKFSIQTDKPALFYISDTYFPGWTAEVRSPELAEGQKGKPLKIYRANYNLRAVLVPQGSSRIDFSYVPSHFSLYVVLSVSSLVSLILLAILVKRRL